MIRQATQEPSQDCEGDGEGEGGDEGQEEVGKGRKWNLLFLAGFFMGARRMAEVACVYLRDVAALYGA